MASIYNPDIELLSRYLDNMDISVSSLTAIKSTFLGANSS